ncbi:MAG: hypothetical protein HPY85_00640 [Anaerolineae bacterium]|nr:hypothetical protein [Anaerolineae bacterium]
MDDSIQVTERVERLRKHALSRLDEVAQPRREIQLLAARGWRASAGEPWTILRRAQENAAILCGMTPVIDTDEWIVGKTCYRALTGAEEAELDAYQHNTGAYLPVVGGQTAHMAIDFDHLLQVGVVGIREEIEQFRTTLNLTDPRQQEQDAFYRACLISLEALVTASHHYAALAMAQAQTASTSQRQQELEQIAAVCRRVPEYPAATFHEAIQCAHFVTFALCCAHQTFLFQYGHPDRYLLPYYRNDVAQGTITPAQAQEWVDCLAVMLTEYTPQHLAVGWMLGGRDAQGRDVCNELTELFLRSLRHVPLAYPCTGLAWTSDTPLPIRELAADLLAGGLSHPAIFNDAVITKGLMDLGLPWEEACLYQQSTCVEITPCAASNVYVASPYINLPQLLQDVLGVPGLGAEAPANRWEHLDTFEDLLAAYRQRLTQAIEAGVMEQNALQMTRRYNGGKPLLSCFVNDCLARGRDIDHGGARYNWIEPSFVGLANLVDALHAVRQLAYQKKSIGLAQFSEMLKANYAECEPLRCQIEYRLEKYGNDIDAVDDLAQMVTHWVAEIIGRYRNYLDGRFVSGFFCWVMHERLGRETAATADGRKAGFPLGDGSGPAQGRERQGPTAAILSTTKWDHSAHIGGIALNLKFIPPQQRDVFRARLVDLIDTYIDRGGFEVQVNVVDRQKLEAARAHPQEYQDLVVRIGGYSDYFVRLSPEMQDEVILRTEHAA